MVLDRALGDEQLSGDLSVCVSARRKARNLGLPGRELVERVHGPFAGMLAGRQQLAFGTELERLGAHDGERLERGAQLLPGVEAATFAAQPLPVEKMSPGELESGEHVAPGQEAECELQVRERARVAGDLHLASGEEMQGRVVPHLEGDDVAVSSGGD